MIDAILDKSRQGVPLTLEDAVALLEIPNGGEAYYRLLGEADRRSRQAFHNRGMVFAQIGLNSAPCEGECAFCSLARQNFSGEPVETPLEDVMTQAAALAAKRVDAVFLMTTADFDRERFLEIGRAVRAAAGGIPLVANTGDFDAAYAARLRGAGFTGAYHIVRLGEGQVTALPPEQRVRTLDAIRDSGLELYYCVEPIGPEHTPQELAREMLRARDYGAPYMAVMRRVNVPGSRFWGGGTLTERDMARIAAAARLVADPKKSMNVHEPMMLPLLAGCNQLYAELGANPRDRERDTGNGRGVSVERVREMLREADYEV